MVSAEQKSIEFIDKAVKQYIKDTKLSLELLQLTKNESFEQIDDALFEINKYSGGYLKEDLAKIKRLKKLVEKYKKIMMDVYVTLKRDVELHDGKISRSLDRYSAFLYQFDPQRFAQPISLVPPEEENIAGGDSFVEGSLQRVFDTDCYVFGTEGDIDERFTGHQGNNNFGMQQNCGIACVAQLLILAGRQITENDVVRVAVGQGLCSIDDPNMRENGATSSMHRADLLRKFDIKNDIKLVKPRDIAVYIERGHGVIASVDAGLLWDQPSHIGSGHAVLLYGSIHRASDGELMGYVICDTGTGDMCRFVSITAFDRMYNYNNGLNITAEPIR
ncbi:MAG: hypothetical protein J6V80_01630 [Clostridia bacterium]|nr:hypothetical protein [Clostridia bacterium]